MTKKILLALSVAFVGATMGAAQIVPYNLTSDLDTLTGVVRLQWEFPGIQELIYENGPTGYGYSYDGYTMSSRMSPGDTCQVLVLKIHTSWEGADSLFDAEVYNWAGSAPGTTLLHRTEDVTAQQEEWTLVDISSAGLQVTGDFMVGFGSISDSCFMGYDPDLNNNRSWDFNRTAQTWAPWSEAYIIRAIVQYNSGEVVELAPTPVELIRSDTPITPGKRLMHTYVPKASAGLDDAFLEFIIYRDGIEEGSTMDFWFTNALPDYGTYIYTVTALFDTGESEPSNPDTVIWSTTGIYPDQPGARPEKFELTSICPNPFNPTTTLTYTLPAAARVRLTVYDVFGREVAVLVDGWREMGWHEATFSGSHLASGIYLYRFEAHNYQASGKMVLLK